VKKRIFILGRALGSYRTQNFIKYFVDNNSQIFYDSYSGYLINTNQNIVIKAFRYFVKVLDYLFHFLVKLYYLLRADIVFLSAMNNNNRLINVARLFKKTIISDFYISMYDTQVFDRKKFKPTDKYAMRLLRNDQYIIDKSDLIFFLNNTEARYYLNILGYNNIDEINYKIVPLCIEERFICDLPYFSGKSSIINICWWGTYIPLHGLEKIIEACKILKTTKNINFMFHMFGDSSPKADYYQKMIDDFNLNDVIKIYRDYSFINGKLGDFLKSNCDIVLGNFGDSYKAKNVIVNKLLDGIAMMAPVVTGESIAPKEYFTEDMIVYTVNNPESIANGIYKLYNTEYEDINKMITKAYSIFKLNFSVEAFRKNINGIFE
jgi:glycosyltransferase involved in cell wall biosynthesis